MVSRLISKFSLAGIAAIALVGCMWAASPSMAKDEMATLPQPTGNQEVAIFAGGCFWCVESDFDQLPGVISTTSGYTGGTTDNPTYKEVSYKETGHYEAVQVIYDPDVIQYPALLEAFWHSVDVTDDGGQFCDRGSSYRTAVFADETQLPIANESKDALSKGEWPKAPVVTPVLPKATFYPAETYHQDYYKKSPIRYRYYRNGCGRDNRVKEVWGPLAFKGIPKS